MWRKYLASSYYYSQHAVFASFRALFIALKIHHLTRFHAQYTTNALFFNGNFACRCFILCRFYIRKSQHGSTRWLIFLEGNIRYFTSDVNKTKLFTFIYLFIMKIVHTIHNTKSKEEKECKNFFFLNIKNSEVKIHIIETMCVRT